MINSDITFTELKSLSKDEQKLVFKDVDLLKSMLKRNNISDHRYLHSLSVADTCRSLAKAHNIDEDKAYLAGLLHDVCRFKDSDTSGELEKYLEKYEPSKLNRIHGAYHSWVAYYYLKECGLDDEEVLSAIYNHTILEKETPLNIIVFIADKREPLREIDDDILEISYKDLYLGLAKLKINIYEYLKAKGKING